MKKMILLSAVLATTVFAKTELSLNLGTNSFASKELLENTTTFGVRGDFYLDPLYHIDVGYDDLGSVAIKGRSTKLKVKRVYTQFSSDGEEEYHVVPTLSLGVGYEKQDGSTEDNSPFVSLGVNFRYNVSYNLNFLFGTKALLKTSSRAINYHTTFGIGYMIDEAPVNNKQEILEEEVVVPKQKLAIEPVPVKQMPPVEVSVPDTKEIIVSKKIIPTSVPVETVAQTKITSQVSAPIVQKRSVKTTSRQRGVFIQVAAYSKSVPRAKLDRLARAGKHIVLRHLGNITKALVGPYSSRAEALRDMPSIKRVAPRAFFYKGN